MNELQLLGILYLFIGIPFLFTIDKTSSKLETFIFRLVGKIR